MQRDLAAAVDGAIAGSVATVAMSAVMMAGRKAGALGDQPPERLSERALHLAGIHHHKEATQDALAVILHFGFGGSMGALFGMLNRRLRVPVSAPVQGMIFAAMVWVVSYKGWIPALGVLPPPEHDRPGRPQVMVLAHLVYGLVLGLTMGIGDGRRSRTGAR